LTSNNCTGCTALARLANYSSDRKYLRNDHMIMCRGDIILASKMRVAQDQSIRYNSPGYETREKTLAVSESPITRRPSRTSLGSRHGSPGDFVDVRSLKKWLQEMLGCVLGRNGGYGEIEMAPDHLGDGADRDLAIFSRIQADESEHNIQLIAALEVKAPIRGVRFAEMNAYVSRSH